METDVQIVETTHKNLHLSGLCGYKNPKKEGFPQKAAWLTHQFTKGLRIKTLWSDLDGAQGMIEFTPGEMAWRPVTAPGMLFIHCLFVGFRKEYKGHGYAGMMVDACISDAVAQKKTGVAVVCRNGSFMADRRLFEKMRFVLVDEALPDFQLLFLSLADGVKPPRFNHQAMAESLKKYQGGVFILRSDQCPYTVKNVREMCERAESELKIIPRVMTICSHHDAQACPSPFGTFCVIVDGKVQAHHPISATRFLNILRKQG